MECEAAAEREKQLLQEQELSNLLHQKDYLKAVGVAISLDQPYRVLSILRGKLVILWWNLKMWGLQKVLFALH